MEDKPETIVVDRATAEKILTGFLIENDLYDEFIYGLKHCSSRDKPVKSIKEFTKVVKNYNTAIMSAFSWSNYERTDYGRKHYVNWSDISREYESEFSNLVEKHSPKMQIMQALSIIN